MHSYRYQLVYRNQEWLYSVYRSEEKDEYLLVAVVPAVGWYDIAMILNPAEAATFTADKAAFTGIVNSFLSWRERPAYKSRRVESRVQDGDRDTVILSDEADSQR